MNSPAKSLDQLYFLMLEDSAADAELILAMLKKADLNFQSMRVETESAFRSTLEVQPVDLILADYSLPTFNGIKAITIAQEVCPDVPCILVSGVLGEEKAIDALKSGATDYVLKQRLERLVPAVKRAVKERREKLALQQAERDREESEQRFQTLMDTIADPLAVMVAKREQGIIQDFTVRHLSKPACDYLSIPAEEAYGRSIFNVVPAFRQAEVDSSDLNFFDCLVDIVETGVSFSEEIILKGHEYASQQVAIDARAAKLNDGIVFTWRDVTEKHQLVQQQQRLLLETEAALNHAEQANQFKDDFLATVSHELRSPLSTIKGWINILERQPGSAEIISQAHKVIARNTTLLENLIEDLLDVSRIAEGKLAFDPRLLSFDQLKQIITNTTDAINPIASQKKIRVAFHCDRSTVKLLSPHWNENLTDESSSQDEQGQSDAAKGKEDLSRYVIGDTVRLQQVVRNLLSNAIKFTPEEGQIDITLSAKEETISLSVKDTGRGIEATELPYLFERFWQAPSITLENKKQKAKGLGLGLSITQYIMELHHGSIRAESSGVNKGSTFTVELPTLSREPVPILPVRGSTKGAVRGDQSNARIGASLSVSQDRSAEIDVSLLHGIKILVVEDYPDALEMYQMMLESYGAEVEGASSVEAAMTTFARFKPHIVISDIGLPSVDGYALIRQIRSRSDADGGHVPAIALTAFAETQYRTKALLAGFQMHLAKPIGLYELVEVVAKLALSYSNRS